MIAKLKFDRLLREKALVAYFGYGSLVNRQTHRTDIVHAIPARLKGWKRHWIPRAAIPDHPACMLSVSRDPERVIDGLLIFDHVRNLALIDEREKLYSRVALSYTELEFEGEIPVPCPLFVYEAPRPLKFDFQGQLILRSYLEAVLQGFLVEHGEAGVLRFLSDTEFFEIGVLDDSERPLYPRHVDLTGSQRRTLDALLRAQIGEYQTIGSYHTGGVE